MKAALLAAAVLLNSLPLFGTFSAFVASGSEG